MALRTMRSYCECGGGLRPGSPPQKRKFQNPSQQSRQLWWKQEWDNDVPSWKQQMFPPTRGYQSNGSIFSLHEKMRKNESFHSCKRCDNRVLFEYEEDLWDHIKEYHGNKRD